MSADGPDLRAVGADEAAPAASEPATAPERTSWGRGLVVLLLVVALVIAFAAYWNESQRTQELEGRVASLQAEIGEARDELRVHQERMQVVRGHVDDLAGRIGLLQQAIATPAE